MTMETVFGHLLARTRTITLLEDPAYKRGLAVRGPQSLRVAMTSA
jgi:hypothetical protein